MAINILGKYIRAKYLVSEGLFKTFYGIGPQEASKICARVGLFPKMRMHQLSEQQIMSITKELAGLTIENEARNVVRENIAFKRKIGSYSGIRHLLGFPVHGQNTRNNGRTAKKLNKLNRSG
ncbi:putative mitochondrial 37S ribosomal protein [Saccharomycopsis crataegensis]|uniref:Mitochondrial 37S ribosomal protein n=1 Tax=Saccharomycopsis crataegensis TaxID=43959 RepID=A0AAV5QKJ8_9ASCO|nr:putative mitochondrial 37S ribosomal protein [Saccharomycopsis crataegensis]